MMLKKTKDPCCAPFFCRDHYMMSLLPCAPLWDPDDPMCRIAVTRSDVMPPTNMPSTAYEFLYGHRGSKPVFMSTN